MKKIVSVTAVMALLAGCSGGGGASTDGSGGTPPVAPTLIASPASIDVTQYEGMSASVGLVINAGTALPSNVRWTFQDAAAPLFLEEQLQLGPNGTLQGYLRTNPGLGLGLHQSAVTYKLCEDETVNCAKPLAGSPLTLPVRINVKPIANLTPLTVTPELGAWGNYQGDSAHTGYRPASFATADFAPRWRSRCITQCLRHALASASGSVYQVQNGALESVLTALDEASGTPRWRVEFPNYATAHRPVLANGRLYVFSTSKLGAYLRSYDPNTGTLLGTTPLSNLIFSDAPASDLLAGPDGGLYLAEGEGLTKRDADGALIWRNAEVGAVGSAMAVDATYLYAYTPAKLTLLDVNDGRVVAQVSVDTPHRGTQGIPVLASAERLYVVQPESGATAAQPGVPAASTFVAFDLKARKVKWALAGKYFTQPAVGPDGIYVLNDRLLEVRNPEDGSLLWSVTLDSSLASRSTELLLTRSHAFLSNWYTTYAVELGKREVAWTFPSGGSMALSDRGVLYIGARVTGPFVPGLFAINLR